MKLKAGALQYIIFISIVIAIIVAAFILLISLNKQFKQKSQIFQQLILNTNNALSYATQRDLIIQDSLILTAKNELQKSVLTKKPWGIFNKITAKATFKKQQFKKTAFLGGFKTQKPALYLQETNKPLVLVGDTKITGKAYLPNQGVKRGTIAGHSYNGSQLIYGSQVRSRQHLPSIENRTYLQNLSNGSITTQLTPFNLEKNNIGISKQTHSFKEITKYYKQNGIVKLKNLELLGNYIIQSDTLIQVFNTSKLKDVILIAPYIDIQAQTKGNFQAFATKGIIVEKDCLLDYPTVLLLAEKTKNNVIKGANRKKENHQIQINNNVEIKGVVCFLTNDLDNNHKTQINIQKNAIVIGEVYNEKNTSLNGIVNGSVYTNAFITNAFGSIYHNHIYNGVINSNEVPIQFSGLTFKNEQKSIVQWVY